MMRSSNQEYLAARVAGRNGIINAGAATIDYGAANRFKELGRNAAETADVDVWQIDGSDRLLQGAQFVNPSRQPICLILPNNASIGNNMAQTFFIAQDNMDLTNIFEIHSTAGTNGSPVTAVITKETGRQAPGTGTVLMTGTFNLKGTANTLQTATLAYQYGHYEPGNAPVSSISLNANDRLSVVITGTVTSLVGLGIWAYAKPGMSLPFISKAIFLNADIATQYIYLANNQRTITGVKLVAAVGGSVVGTVTADITKESSTTAPGGGTTVLAAAINVSSTYVANTVTSPALSATASVLSLAAGERLSLKMTGTLTALAGLYLIVYFASTFDKLVDATLSIGPNGLQSDRIFFIADRAYEIMDSSEAHGTAAGGTLKGLITIDTGTTAPGAGTATQTDNASTGFDLNATANTVQVATPGPLRNRLLKAGDRLGWKNSASVASLANVVATCTLRPM